MRNSRTLAMIGLAVFAALTGCRSNDHGPANGVPTDAKVEAPAVIEPNAAVHVAAGDLAFNQGNRGEAQRQFEKAIELDPTNRAALFKLATLLTYDGKFDQAISSWQRYVDATGQSANGYSNLGKAHELAGHWKDAEVNYLKALSREPSNKGARVNYGLLLAKRDRFDEAEEQLAKALTPAEVQYDLGSVHEMRKDYPAAQAAYEKAIQLDGKLVAARQRLAMLRSVTAAQ